MSDVDLGLASPTPPEVELELGNEHQAVDIDELAGDLDAGPVPVITEQQLRDVLDGAGRAMSIGALSMGVPNELTPTGRGLWRFTADELDGLVPPLCRVVNRRPPLARAVAKGDEVFVILQLAGYFGKRGDVVLEARKARKEAPGGDDQRQARRDAQGTDAGVGPFPGVAAGNGASRSSDAAPSA